MCKFLNYLSINRLQVVLKFETNGNSDRILIKSNPIWFIMIAKYPYNNIFYAQKGNQMISYIGI